MKPAPAPQLALRLLYGAAVVLCAYVFVDSALSLRALTAATAVRQEKDRRLLLRERDALLARRGPMAQAAPEATANSAAHPAILNQRLRSLAEIKEILGRNDSSFRSAISRVGLNFYNESRGSISPEFARLYGLTPEQRTLLQNTFTEMKTRIEATRLRQASVRETEKQVVIDLAPLPESKALRDEVWEVFRSVMSEDQFLWFQMLSGPDFDRKLNAFGSNPVKYTLDYNDRGEPVKMTTNKPMSTGNNGIPHSFIPEFAQIASQLPPNSISDAKLTVFRGDLSGLILEAKRAELLRNAMRAELKDSSQEAALLYMLAHGGSQPKSFAEAKDVTPYFRDRADAEHFMRLYNKVLSETSR